MENQITSNENAMRLFFTEDIFLVEDKDVVPAPISIVKSDLAKPEIVIETAPEADTKPEIVEIPGVKVAERAPEYLKVDEKSADQRIFKHLGGNQKSVLILVNDEVNDVSTDQGKILLRNIVKAINLATPDFALVNYAHYKGADFTELHAFYKPTLMLAFGVSTADLKLNINWANEILLHQTTRMIFAPNLHQLDADLNAKKLLWGNLKKV